MDHILHLDEMNVMSFALYSTHHEHSTTLINQCKLYHATPTPTGVGKVFEGSDVNTIKYARECEQIYSLHSVN